MKSNVFLLLFPLLMMLMACDGFFPNQSKDFVPSDHTSRKDGVYHMPGSEDPFGSGGCAIIQCHGMDLMGDVSLVEQGKTVTPSCYQCHGNVWDDEREDDHERGHDD